MSDSDKDDLVILVADQDAKLALEALFKRPPSLGIHPIKTPEIHRHSHRDPGCRTEGVDFLIPFASQFSHAILFFDYEGSGEDTRKDFRKTPEQIEKDLEDALAKSGWDNRAAVIVLTPELEIWMWSESPHVVNELGWQGSYSDLKGWLEEKGLWESGRVKPDRPKEAVEALLRAAKKPLSSRLYQSLAKKVSLSKCNDPSFVRFKKILQKWFPGDSSDPSQTFA
jgi:hypothetical protein